MWQQASTLKPMELRRTRCIHTHTVRCGGHNVKVSTCHNLSI